MYAGNNEDYQCQEQNGLTYKYEDKSPEHWLKTDFPARYIYEKLLPEAVERFSPAVQYHPGSPWGDGKPTSDPTVGDLHQWNGKDMGLLQAGPPRLTRAFSLARHPREIPNLRYTGWAFQFRIWNGSLSSYPNNQRIRDGRKRAIPTISYPRLSQQR